MLTSRLAAGALCLSLVAGAAQSAVVFEFKEVGANVVGTLSGSLNLAGAMFFDFGSGLPVINSSLGLVGTGTESDSIYRLYRISGPASFGSGPQVLGTRIGHSFRILGTAENPSIGVSPEFTNGLLSATLTFANQSFGTLGVAPGSHVWTVTGTTETVTVTFVPSAVVPLPATLPLLLGGLGLAWAAARRRGTPRA